MPRVLKKVPVVVVGGGEWWCLNVDLVIGFGPSLDKPINFKMFQVEIFKLLRGKT